MKVYTRIEFQMTADGLELIRAEGLDHRGAVAECKSKKPSESEKAAKALQEQERQRRDAELAAGNKTLSAVEAGDVEQTPLYQRLYGTGAHQIADTFDNASASTRRRGQLAGFGYAQPISQASEAIVDSQRARALSDLPGATTAQVIPTLTGTAQQRMQRAGAYDPEYYFGDYSKQEQERRKSPGLWGRLATLGVTAAGAAAGAACWIAEALWGEDDERTHVVRWWLNAVYGKTVTGKAVMWAYRRYGQPVAAKVHRYPLLKAIFLPIFSLALWRARRELARHLVFAA